MRTVLNFLACGALSAALVFSIAARAAPADGRADAPPWVVSNGQPDAGLYMPREVQQAYAKGTRSLDGRPLASLAALAAMSGAHAGSSRIRRSYSVFISR